MGIQANATSSKKKQLSLENWKFMKTDTKTIVGALLMGAIFTLIEQFMERLDTMTSGGTLPWFGIAIGGVFMMISPYFFGWIGGLITGIFNPIFSVLTATSPLAPMFFIFNITTLTVMALILQMMKKSKKPIDAKSWFLISIVSLQCIMILLTAMWIILFQYSGTQLLTYIIIEESALIVCSILSFFAANSIAKSGVLK